MQKIAAAQYKSVTILTGAGISRASGLPTYRGPGGLWNNPETAKVSSKDCFIDSPQSSWQFWGEIRAKILDVEPNKAHQALARWQNKFSSGSKFTLITQNVDELHQRAGSKEVVELHGSLFMTKCSSAGCSVRFRDTKTYSGTSGGVIPKCENCGGILRPDITLFGEALPPEAEHRAKKAFRDCDLFIGIGTSGKVSPASEFVRWAKYASARTILINLEKMDPPNESYDLEIVGKAEELLDEILV